jgi:hypothetical protein
MSSDAESPTGKIRDKRHIVVTLRTAKREFIVTLLPPGETTLSSTSDPPGEQKKFYDLSPLRSSYHIYMMKRTRGQIKALRRKLKQAGVAKSTIFRVLSGKSRPSLGTVLKLIDALDEESATKLIAAFLSDEVPPKLRRRVRILVRDSAHDEFKSWSSAAQKFEALPPDLQLHHEALMDAYFAAAETKDSEAPEKSPPAPS